MQDDDGLQRFLAAAGEHRLLTPGEEKALARIIQTEPGVASTTMPHNCGTCPSCKARHELVECNIRLVVSVARYYRGRGLDFADVIQNGIVGLDRAARKFDPDRSIRFSTYATLWIKQSIQRGLTGGGSTIKLPANVAGHRARMRAALAINGGLSREELAEDLEIKLSDIERVLGSRDGETLPAAEVVTSLNREVTTDEHSHTLMDAMSDPFAEDPQELEDNYAGFLYEALDALEAEKGHDYRQVIELRFGIGGQPPLSPKEVTRRLGHTDNTTKRIQEEALAFLAAKLSRATGLVSPRT